MYSIIRQDAGSTDETGKHGNRRVEDRERKRERGKRQSRMTEDREESHEVLKHFIKRNSTSTTVHKALPLSAAGTKQNRHTSAPLLEKKNLGQTMVLYTVIH